MSHFCVLVVGNTELESQMAPFNEQPDEDSKFLKWSVYNRVENESHYFGTKKEAKAYLKSLPPEAKYDEPESEAISRSNPNAKWDWYEVGGRWAGFFKVKKGAIGRKGKQYNMGNKLVMTEDKADQLLKGDIDINFMRKEKYEAALKDYDATLKAFDGDIPKIEKTWDEFIKDKSYTDFEKRREDYWNQPSMKRVKAAQDKNLIDIWGFDLLEYQCDRETFTQRAASDVLSTFAVLKDGVWYERGGMGWWGMVHDEKDQDKWNEEFMKLFNEISDETLLTLVDCHI